GRPVTAPPDEVLEHDPGLTHRESKAGQDQELRELSASDQLVLGPVDGEVVAPLGLVVEWPAVRRHGEPVRVLRPHGPISWKTFSSMPAGLTASSFMAAVTSR